MSIDWKCNTKRLNKLKIAEWKKYNQVRKNNNDHLLSLLSFLSR